MFLLFFATACTPPEKTGDSTMEPLEATTVPDESADSGTDQVDSPTEACDSGLDTAGGRSEVTSSCSGVETAGACSFVFVLKGHEGGVYDDYMDLSYDAAGTLRQSYVWTGASAQTHIYNEDGLLLTESYSWLTGSEWRDYTYDAHGNVLTTEFQSEVQHIWTYWTWTYDADGRAARAEEYSDYTGETTSYGYTYDAHGKVVLVVRDEAMDGWLDTIYSWSYDAQDRLLRYQRNDGADGDIDFYEEYVHDGNGRLVSLERDTGTYLYTYVYGYDDTGLLVTETSSVDGRSYQTDTYTYDATRRLLTIESDWGLDGGVDTIERYFYNGEGLLSDTVWWSEGGCNAVYSHAYFYLDCCPA